MINSKVQIGLIAGALIALGIGLTLYKAISLDLPLVPGQYREVWTVESKTSFTPTRISNSSQAVIPVNIELKLPLDRAGWVILEEHFPSSGFGFSILEQDDANVARWTRQGRDRPTTL